MRAQTYFADFAGSLADSGAPEHNLLFKGSMLMNIGPVCKGESRAKALGKLIEIVFSCRNADCGVLLSGPGSS